MLTLEERKQAIEILTQNQITQYYSLQIICEELLRDGFKGYARFSDGELIRALNKLSRENRDSRAQNFVGNLLVDKIVLGD